MQAQIQELRIEAMSMNTSSGIITKKTKFVFRSRSSRIIWLLQMSAEMWDFDRVNAQYCSYAICILTECTLQRLNHVMHFTVCIIYSLIRIFIHTFNYFLMLCAYIIP